MRNIFSTLLYLPVAASTITETIDTVTFSDERFSDF